MDNYQKKDTLGWVIVAVLFAVGTIMIGYAILG
ncbi:hypothetical protein Thermo_00092 [Thermoplasmatales archaeon]|nr:hypothetical protein Thermo_00092 [Thermoplasmatales archaeon]